MRKAIIAAGLAALLASSAVQAQTAAPAAAPVAASADDWRTIAPENLLVIDTAKGRILVELIPVAAPNHAERIRTLANQGFYDGLKFHRVIPGFMAQTGDPKGTGEGGSDLPDLKAEFHFRRGRDAGFVAVPNAGAGLRGLVGDLPVQTQPDAQMMVTADFKVDAHGLFCPGVLGMARSGSPDSANSQFFLMMGARDQLDGVYTAFGRVVSGMDVLDKIKKGSDAEDGKVTDPRRHDPCPHGLWPAGGTAPDRARAERLKRGLRRPDRRGPHRARRELQHLRRPAGGRGRRRLRPDRTSGGAGDMVRNAWAAVILTAILSGPALAQEAAPPPPPPATADWRVISSSDLLVIDTTKGRILVELAPELAPAHVERIKLLTARGFYDNLAWHRVIDWFMAQTGDPLGTGDGQSWYPDLKGEFTFRRGAGHGLHPRRGPDRRPGRLRPLRAGPDPA